MWNLLLGLVFVGLPIHTAGTMCFDCSRVSSIGDCRGVTKCAPDEECFVRKYRTNLGDEKFDFSCNSKIACKFLTDFGGFGRRDEELQLCAECCDGDFCQANATKCQSGFQLPHMCFTCDGVHDPVNCDVVRFCDGEHSKCYVHNHVNKFGESVYSMGCQKPHTCNIWNNFHSTSYLCYECCDSKLCNANANICNGSSSSRGSSSGQTSSLAPAPPSTTPSTTPSPPSTTTTAVLSTTVAATTTPAIPPAASGDSNQFMAVQDETANITFSCNITGTPPLQVKWYKEGGSGSPIKSGVMMQPGVSTLTIDHPQASHAGKYQCQVVNGAGSDSITYDLTVHVKPTFKQMPQNVTVAQGHNVTLHCEGEGDPKPTLLWGFRDKFAFPLALSSVPRVTVSAGNTTVDITQVDHDNIGVYVCRLQNSAGTKLQFAHVSIA